MVKKLKINRKPNADNWVSGAKDIKAPIKRFTVDIPEELYVQMRHSATDSGITLKDFICDAIRKSLSSN